MRSGDSQSEFHDHSTTNGKLRLYCLRVYKPWFLFIILGLSTLAAIMTYYSNPSTQLTLGVSSALPDYEVNFSNGKLVVTGAGDIGSVGSSAAFVTLPTTIDVESLTVLEMRNVLIDAPKFSEILQSYSKLQSIRLDQVWITGDFLRVFLPNLGFFHLNQVRNDRTDSYKLEVPLRSLVFFDLQENSDWDVHKDLLNLGIKTQISLGGTTIMDVDREVGRININVHYCHEMLENLEEDQFPPVRDLTLSWCTITLKDVPSTVKYLNLNNAVPSTEEFNSLIASLEKLEEFHGLLPKSLKKGELHWNNNSEHTDLKLTSINPALKVLSLANIDIVPPKTSKYSSNLTHIFLENSLNSKLVDTFDRVFTNAKRVAIFSTDSIPSPYKLIQKILAIRPDWILIEGFNRTEAKHDSFTTKVEETLTLLQISKETTHFTLELADDGITYNAVALTLYERNFYRYTLLGFDRVDTYEDYVIWDNQ